MENKVRIAIDVYKRQAVNTLVRTEGGFKGYNTDILGLDRELSDVGISLEDKCVVIIGAGGAARAIAFLCAGKKASEIYIMNRTLEKAQNIACLLYTSYPCVYVICTINR